MFTHRPAVEFDAKKIDAIFAEFDQCHLPGAAVGIAIGGKPVYRKGFGLASMELPIVLSPSIRMRIGSTTKQFAAFAYMLLCEEGKAGIDDPIGKYFPELHSVTHNVTMRQLMGNIGGLRDALAIISAFRGHLNAHVTGRPTSTAEVLSLYRDIDDLNAAPGTAWTYNNGGFVLLSVVIERITGQTLEHVMWERIFEPLGMYDTLVRHWDTDFVANSSTPHHLNSAGFYERAYFGYDYAGGGAIVSTVNDMLRWLAHMDTPRLGSAATWAAMKTPHRLANGTSSGYGLGLFIDRYRGVETLHHAGSWVGSSTQMLKVPAAGLNVVVMVNRGDVWAPLLVNKILDACLPGLDPSKEPFKGPFATGIFRSPTTGRVIQFFAKEGQQIASVDGMDMLVEPDDDGVLWPEGISPFFKQALTLVGDREKPASIRFSDVGNLDDLAPVRPVSKPNVGAIAGRYRSDTTGIEATISDTEDGPRMITVGRFGSTAYVLECLADGVWRVKSREFGDGILSFEGDVAAFRFSNYFTRSLPFRRCV
jgi:D-aminopeptidase